jgi:hypothetical protein
MVGFKLRDSGLTEIGSFNESQYKTYGYKSSETLNSSSTCGDDTPHTHNCWEI